MSKTKTPLQKETITLFEKTNKFLNDYYEVFYKFNTEKLNELSTRRKELEKEANSILKKDSIITSHLKNTILKLADFSASFFTIRFKPANTF